MSTVQDGVIVWGMFFSAPFGPFNTNTNTNNCLNATAYVSIVADRVHPFIATMYPSSNGYFQHDNAPDNAMSQNESHLKLVSLT